MKKLLVCGCPECGTEFAMQTEDLDEVSEITCPMCEQEFVSPVEEDGGADERDDQEAEDIGQQDQESDGEADDGQRGWPRLTARRTAMRSRQD